MVGDPGFRAIWFAIAITLLLACLGCGGGKKDDDKKKPKEKPILGKDLPVTLTAGDALARDRTSKREPIYHINWKHAEAQASDKGIFAGSMESVTGEMYDNGVVASTFKADHAEADRATEILTLTGHIEMESTSAPDAGKPAARKAQKTTLTCDKLVWHSREKYVVASGNVQVHGTYGILSGLNEVWATPDLKTIASPEMFNKP